jgi:nicotinamidase/pyrazinamidase
MASSKSVVFWEVDAQRDFLLPGGALYVPGGEKILPNLKRLVDAARSGRVFLVSSACEHSPDDPEFKTFGPHCIRGTLGAEIVSEGVTSNPMRVPNSANFDWPEDWNARHQIILEKDQLDVFCNPQTSVLVEKLGKDVQYVVFGVVTEFCVNRASRGLLERGRKVAIVEDAIETLEPAEGDRTLDELTAAGARLLTTDEALALL